MFLKSQLSWKVIVPAKILSVEGLTVQRTIVLRLLEDFASKKVSRDLGYFFAVTKLEKVGEGRVREDYTGEMLVPVEFSCITFKLFRGEILEGVVHSILKHGVFLSCGPMKNVYLSHKMMSGYEYVHGEDAIFLNEKMSRIEKGSVLRCIVVGTKFDEDKKEFQAVVSLEGDHLGPISLSSV